MAAVRRLVVEISQEDIGRIVGGHPLDEIKLLQVVSFLKETPQETAMICRVQFKNPSTRLQDLFKGDRSVRVQLLERSRQGTCVYYVKRTRRVKDVSYRLNAPPGYFSTPYEMRDGKVKLTFLGSQRQLRGILQRLEGAVPCRIVSLGEAKFPLDSPLSRLTDKQVRVLLTAYSLGYYDIPRRATSDELANVLKIRNATLVMHRRRAERKLLADLLGGSKSQSKPGPAQNGWYTS